MSGILYQPTDEECSKAKRLAMEWAAEDYVGLCEFIWEIGSNFPLKKVSEMYALAEEALKDLWEDGAIKFHKRIGDPPFRFELMQTGGAETTVYEIISEPASWLLAPAGEGEEFWSVVFFATEKGERMFSNKTEG